MENIFISLLNTSITAGYLVIAVMLLRPLLKKAPKYIRCILWGLVGLRLILPFSFESVLSLIPSAEPIPPEIVTSPAPVIHSGITFVNSAVNPVISQSMAPAPEASVNPMQIVMAVAWNVWLLGVVAMVLYSVISFVLLKRKLRESVQDGGNVWLCDRVSSPFLLGLFRPKIYLPSDLAEDSKVYVLAHENAHIRRKDHWWKPLGFLLLTVYWFNPLMWVAYIFLCRDIEFACDEKVIKELGTDCKCAYSEALINCSVPRRMISACPVAFGEDGVKGRIKSVLNYKKPAFWIILIALILCIVVAVCFLTNPPEDDQSGKIPANEYRFRATVVEIYEDSLLVEPLEKEEYFSGAKQVVIRLNGRSKDDYRLGCIVEVIYDSQIQESMPPVIPNASSILNLDMLSSHLPDPHYSFTATVTEVWDNCIIVKYQHFPLHNFEFTEYRVITDPTGYAVGDKVNISYDGKVLTTSSFPLTLGTVYSVELAEPKAYDGRLFATVIEIREDSLIVEPDDDQEEREKYDRVMVSLPEDAPEPIRVGDSVTVVYDGIIQGSSPATIPNVSNLIVFYSLKNVSWSAAFDIDNDGIIEDCLIRPGPTYGVLSVEIVVQENGNSVCRRMLGLPGWNNCGFRETSDGKYVFVLADTIQNIEVVFDIFVENRQIYLTNGEQSIDEYIMSPYLVSLKNTYPQFFGLNTFKGLEVLVWKNEDWRSIVLSSTNQTVTLDELQALGEGVTLSEMALILNTYGITQEEIHISYSYYPAIFEEFPPMPTIPTAEEQAYIEKTLFSLLPKHLATEPYIAPEFQVQKQYPLIIYAYKLAENSWRFRFYENTTIFESMQDASMKLDGLTMQDAWAKMEQYDYPPEEIPVIPINSHLSSYYYEINEQTAAEARMILGLIKLSNSDEPTPTEAGPESSGNGYALENGYYSLSGSGKDSFATPYIYIDTAKKTANIGGSPLMSYSESGRYYLLFDRLIVKAQNTTYTFQIQDKNTLVLLSDRGYDKSPIPASGTYVFCGEYPS